MWYDNTLIKINGFLIFKVKNKCTVWMCMKWLFDYYLYYFAHFYCKIILFKFFPMLIFFLFILPYDKNKYIEKNGQILVGLNC